MKKISLFILFSAMISIAAIAPAKTSDIFSKDAKILWLGLDFSKLKTIGISEPGKEIKEKYFPGWNQLLLGEKEKYNVPRMLHREGEEIPMDFSHVHKRNKQLDPETISSFSTEDHKHLKRKDVEKIAKEYSGIETEQEIGLVFIVESFSKTDEEGSMWVTFFDISSGKVLLTERMVGAPGGFSFRNNWARTIYNVMKEIEEKKYKEWEKKHS